MSQPERPQGRPLARLLRRGKVDVRPRFDPRWLRPGTPPLPDWLDDDRWVPAGDGAMYAYARCGLRAVLADRGFGDGDTALLPAFVSSSAVWPFRDLGIEVEFYPVTTSMTLPMELAERIADADPDVVLFVHYVGFPDDWFTDLVEVAREVDALVIEDVARGLFARDSRGRLLGSTGDVALFSPRKLLPIPHGGLVVSSDGTVPDPGPSIRETRAMASVAGRLLRWLRPWHTTSPTESIVDVDRFAGGLPAPEGGPKAAPGRLTRLGLARVDPAAVAAARRDRYARVRESLLDVPGLELVSPPAHEGACPYGVALRLPDGRAVRDRLFARLRRAGLPVERFRWRMAYGEPSLDAFPEAVELHDTLLVVPTHQALPRWALEETVDALTAVPDDHDPG